MQEYTSKSTQGQRGNLAAQYKKTLRRPVSAQDLARWGSLQCSPRPSSWWGGGWLPLPKPHSRLNLNNYTLGEPTERGERWAAPYNKTPPLYFLYLCKLFVTPNDMPGDAIWWNIMQGNPSAAGAPPWTPLEELTAFP